MTRQTRQTSPDVIFNSLRFAKLGSVGSAELDLTYHGFFRSKPSGVHLYDRDSSLRAFIVANARQGYFPVTASIPEGDTRARYMYSTSSADSAWLKLDSLGYAAVHDAARAMNNPSAKAIELG